MSSSSAEGVGPDVRDRVGEVLRGYLAAWGTLDVDAVMAYVTDDVVLEDLTLGHGARGSDELRRFVAASFARVPDARFELLDHVTDGERYAMEWLMQPMGVRGMSFGWLRDGRICQHRDCWNGAAFTLP